MKRAICNLILFVSFLFLPWYCVAALAVAFVFFVNWFWEIIIWAIFADAIYSAPLDASQGYFGMFIICAAAILFLFEGAKRELYFGR